MSAVYGVGGESDTTTSLSFCCAAPFRITLPGKPQSEKPRVRAEPDEPKARLFLETLTLAHRFLTANYDRVCVMNNVVTDCICQNRVGQFVPPTGDVELGA